MPVGCITAGPKSVALRGAISSTRALLFLFSYYYKYGLRFNGIFMFPVMASVTGSRKFAAIVR